MLSFRLLEWECLLTILVIRGVHCNTCELDNCVRCKPTALWPSCSSCTRGYGLHPGSGRCVACSATGCSRCSVQRSVTVRYSPGISVSNTVCLACLDGYVLTTTNTCQG